MTWRNFAANPPGQKFSAAVEFDGSIVYGTSAGLLRRIDRQEDFTGTPETIHSLSRIEFLNDEFIAYRAGSDTNPPGPVLISGDARRWRSGKSFSIFSDYTETNPSARVFLGGRYFATTSAGWIPSSVSAGGLPAGVIGARAAATDGTRWLVVGSGQAVYSVSMDGAAWTPHQATGLSLTQNITLVHFNGKWFLCNRESSNPALYSSVDGITWSKVPAVSPGSITVFNGKLCGLSHSGSTLHESVDGTTWSSFETGISVGTTRSTSSTTVTVKRLLVFDDKLITLVRESLSARASAFFSEDART